LQIGVGLGGNGVFVGMAVVGTARAVFVGVLVTVGVSVGAGEAVSAGDDVDWVDSTCNVCTAAVSAGSIGLGDWVAMDGRGALHAANKRESAVIATKKPNLKRYSECDISSSLIFNKM
jgi:hypothetical protein